MWVLIREDFQHEQDALDKLVDSLEDTEQTGYFIPYEDLYDYGEDEYCIAGNHSLYLYHGGLLSVELEG